MDTSRFRDLTTAPGPFASVYFESSHETADAEKQLELKWRALREELATQQASESALAALDGAIADGARSVGVRGRALIANDDKVLFDGELTEPPAQSVARYSQLPYLLPLAAHAEPGVAHVSAIVDHIGVDLYAVDRNGQRVTAKTTEGADHPVHKVRSGTEAHTQSRAEETVRQNLAKAGTDITALATSTGAGFVVLAGELQARKSLLDVLEPDIAKLVVELEPGGRAEGSAGDELRRQIDELVEQRKRNRLDESIASFHAEAGAGARASQGVASVVAALRAGNVATLLVGKPAEVDVYVGDEPATLGTSETELSTQGSASGSAQRADEALPLAAVAVGADLLYAGDRLELAEGFGALLRHT